MDLIPIQEAAAQLQVHRVSLHRYIKSGRLTAYRRGFDNRTYIDRAELRELLEPRVVVQSEGVEAAS